MSETFTFLDIYLWTHTSYGKSPPARFLSKSKVRFFPQRQLNSFGGRSELRLKVCFCHREVISKSFAPRCYSADSGTKMTLAPTLFFPMTNGGGGPLPAARHHKSPAHAMCNRFSLSSTVSPTTVVTVAVKYSALLHITWGSAPPLQQKGILITPEGNSNSKKRKKSSQCSPRPLHFNVH